LQPSVATLFLSPDDRIELGLQVRKPPHDSIPLVTSAAHATRFQCLSVRLLRSYFVAFRPEIVASLKVGPGVKEGVDALLSFGRVGMKGLLQLPWWRTGRGRRAAVAAGRAAGHRGKDDPEWPHGSSPLSKAVECVREPY
jgi:hypothetical protein